MREREAVNNCFLLLCCATERCVGKALPCALHDESKCGELAWAITDERLGAVACTLPIKAVLYQRGSGQVVTRRGGGGHERRSTQRGDSARGRWRTSAAKQRRQWTGLCWRCCDAQIFCTRTAASALF